MTANGTLVGSYMHFEDAEVPGIRVAVCPSAVGAVMDADECRDATLICIGGRVVKVNASMDTVLGWLLAGAVAHWDAIGPGGRSREHPTS
jgi:ribose 5-phosphate isomerase RpiB